jgi:hypothetical protein
MAQSVEITTPIPSAAAVAKRLGVSPSRFRILRDIATGRLREKRGDTKVGTLRLAYGDSFLQGWKNETPLKAVRQKTGKSLVQLIGDHEAKKLTRTVSLASKTGRHAETTR